MREHRYFVYMICSSSRHALYTGVSRSLSRRLYEHRHPEDGSQHFSAQYRTFRLVHFEVFQWIHAAIQREKEIKGWRREKKDALITQNNPTWRDLMPEN